MEEKAEEEERGLEDDDCVCVCVDGMCNAASRTDLH